MNWRIAYKDVKKRMAIFVSKYEHCIYDLLLRFRLGELDCEIPLIVSNHNDLRAFAEGFGVPYHASRSTRTTSMSKNKKKSPCCANRR
jgi:formyltetrahydrofolate deformylase